jgi:hypothetical protein
MSSSAYDSIIAELEQLAPRGGVLDGHSHLGSDEDGSSLNPGALLEALDEVSGSIRAVVFPLQDRDRHPAYRAPNDRVLEWCRESGGRLIAYCRLDPDDDPVAEAERCLAKGARGIKLHPRGREWESVHPAIPAIFAVAREAGVPILLHAGRNLRSMGALVEVALQFPEVALVLAHAGIADQAILTTGLARHPCVLYDTSCFAPHDLVELFAQVPAERIVFGSDAPYGQPAEGLFLAMRAAAYAGLDADDRALVAGGTMTAVVDGNEPPAATPPRLARVRPVAGSLVRVATYLLMGFSAVLSATPLLPSRALPWIELARGVCRDPDPGDAGSALARIDDLLNTAEQLITAHEAHLRRALRLIHAAVTIAATEPLPA